MAVIDKVRYAVNEILSHYDEPSWRHDRIIDYILHPIHSEIYPTYENASRVTNKDWDNLIILDACRSDLFEERVDCGKLDHYQTISSYGSSTPEWTHRNFHGRQHGDIVYVTSNPWTSRIAGDAFHDVIEVWKEGFDEDIGTVPPSAVVKDALSAQQKYPNKRFIIHFMQPHIPFIESQREFSKWSPKDIVDENIGGDGARTTVWEALRHGKIDKRSLWNEYGNNLDYVMDYIFDLIPQLSGKTVVSSDHGNMLGEWGWPLPMRIYGHPAGLRSAQLVNVPWAVFEGERRNIEDDGVSSVETGGTEELEDRLRALGYKQ